MVKMTRAKWANTAIAITGLCVLAIVIQGAALDENSGLDKAIPIQTTTISRGNFETLVNLEGTVGYLSQVPCMIPLTGQVEQVYVAQGDTVLKNTPLFRLNCDTETALLEKAYQQKAQKAAPELKGESQLAWAAYTEKEDGLLDEKIAELEQAIALKTIRAANDGQVTDLAAYEGSYLTVGSIGAVVCGKERAVSILAVQKDAARIKKGMKVRLYEGESLVGSGLVTGVGTLMADQTTGLMAAKVTVAVQGDTELPVGAKVKAQVVLFAKEDVLVVPGDSVDGENQLWQVYENRVFPLAQSVLQLNEAQAWVENGLEGMAIALLPSGNFKAGQKVKEVGK